MELPRSSGILLHPTSLPGANGIGTLGAPAFAFADFLEEAGQRIWQMLPLGPTGYGDSPYQLFSAFAGNPLLIDLCEGAGPRPAFPENTVAFEQVAPWKEEQLAKCFENFPAPADFAEFQARNVWLRDYSLFMALKRAHGLEHSWTDWEPELVSREPAAMERWSKKLAREIERLEFEQYEFFRQWRDLREYCRQRKILLMGDLPIYVAHDSADVWAHPELFQLDERGRPTVVAGVPPDYFSATGQLWGNPIYNWTAMAATGYRWWIERLRSVFQQFDLVRLDHFRGFEAFWEVPATEKTAVNGRWVKAPGVELFEAARRALGQLPIVAENLGVITPEVEAIRERFGFPGMAVLQFAFGADPQAPTFQPHNYPRERFAYTGTHDNDTTVGWWASTGEGDSTRTPEQVRQEKQFAREYLNTDGREIHWAMIRTLEASPAEAAIVPLQDVLGLGSEARMNTPGTSSGNWRWRFREGDLTRAHAERLRRLTQIYGRL